MDTPSILVKTLKISDETHARLAKLGSVGDTFEDVIKGLLNEHEELKKRIMEEYNAETTIGENKK